MFFAFTTGMTPVAASRESLTRSVVLGLGGVEGFVDNVVPSKNSDVSLEVDSMVRLNKQVMRLDMRRFWKRSARCSGRCMGEAPCSKKKEYIGIETYFSKVPNHTCEPSGYNDSSGFTLKFPLPRSHWDSRGNSSDHSPKFFLASNPRQICVGFLGTSTLATHQHPS